MRALVVAAAAAALLLGACTHSRVVQREPGARPVSTSRPAPARPAIAPLPRGGVHVVGRGETLYGISFRYGLRYQDVGAWNGIGDPYLIEVGQRLRLSPPRRGEPAVVVAPRPAPARPAVSAPPPRPAISPPVPSATVAAPTAPAATAPAPAMVVGSGDWRWPAQGQVIGRFVAGDQTRQGIDIAGKAGQEVQAAADGVVVYSGAGLVGYGELIILKHSEEWLSAYAHNERRLVNEGARVSAGQVIARMGHTGAPRDMLHFEIRRNGKPVDPLGLLPRR